MALKTKISKADHDDLDDSLKTLYIADGDGFKLDADFEDVTGLKNKAAELLAEQKKLKAAMAGFDGIDPEEYKALKAAAEKAEDEKLKASGDIDAIRAQYEERVKAEVAKVQLAFEQQQSENAAILATLKRERLANILTEKGVLPDRVKYVVHEMDGETELIRGDNGFDIRKKGGIGDAPEFDAMIEGVKTHSPFFFAATNAAGSGASGSDNNGGNAGGKTVTRQAYENNPMAYVKALSAGELTLTD